MDPPTIVETHDGEITVAWEPPAFDGGKPVTGYVLEKREPGGRWGKATKEPIKDTQFTCTGLPIAGPFEFRVTALNKAGPNEPSTASKVAKAREPIGKLPWLLSLYVYTSKYMRSTSTMVVFIA